MFESDRRLALNGDVGNDLGFLQDDGAQLEVGLNQRPIHLDRTGLALVADVLHRDVVGTVGQVQRVRTIEIGGYTGAVDQNTSLDQGLTCDGVRHHTGDFAGLRPRRRTQPKGQACNCQSLHQERFIG